MFGSTAIPRDLKSPNIAGGSGTRDVFHVNTQRRPSASAVYPDDRWKAPHGMPCSHSAAKSLEARLRSSASVYTIVDPMCRAPTAAAVAPPHQPRGCCVASSAMTEREVHVDVARLRLVVLVAAAEIRDLAPKVERALREVVVEHADTRSAAWRRWDRRA